MSATLVQSLWSIFGFVVAIGVLVTVHEFGHFWVARRLGVRVLRFSVGFGKPLWMRRGRDGTEYVVAAIPLGGYVKMLDEAEVEGEIPEAERERAFNRKPLKVRAAIVAAGPAFNFLFAILAYWAIYVAGVDGLRAHVGEIPDGTPAAAAGFRHGDRIAAVDGEPTESWEAALFALLDAAIDGEPVTIEVEGERGGWRTLQLDFGPDGDALGEGDLLKNLGLTPWRPRLPAVIGEVTAGSAAERAGLRPGDRIVALDGEPLSDWAAFGAYVRPRAGEGIEVTVERGGDRVAFELTPEQVLDDQGKAIGRAGIVVQRPEGDPYAGKRTIQRYAPHVAFGRALRQTWDMSVRMLRVLGQMLVGRASVDNLSGPISIAQYAGQSAQFGWVTFLGFLAVISISLGVLNLLPVPILDGGHLLYYAIEGIRGRPLSETAQGIGMRIGIAALVALMALALYNDIGRLLR